MRAITLWQPYASLIVTGAKKVETRNWNTNVRGRIAIHAAKKDYSKLFMQFSELERLVFSNNGINSVSTLPRGCILGTVDLVDCLPIRDLIGTEYDTPKEQLFGDWSEGRYGWILKNPIIFADPIPYRGSQGFWNWEEVRK